MLKLVPFRSDPDSPISYSPKGNNVNSPPDIHYNRDGKELPLLHNPESGRTILLLPIFGVVKKPVSEWLVNKEAY